MKIINQIIFITIIITLVFLIKTDYKSVPSHVLSYLQNEISKKPKQEKIPKGDTSTNSTVIGTEKVNSIETPGALVVPDNFLTSNTKNINLTIKGVINITNKERLLNGNLPPLKENSKLDFSAEKKLQDMFVKGYFEHVSPEGVGVGDLGTQVGYDYIIIGENLAMGNFKDDQNLVDAWMNSPGHRANILNNRYIDIGVAVGKGVYDGSNIWMAVQHFGLPKSACPAIDEVLKGVIEINQKNIKVMEDDMAQRRSNIDSGVISDGKTTSEQITEYNVLVNEYNKLVTSIKENINTYNEEVRNFNTCIAGVNK